MWTQGSARKKLSEMMHESLDAAECARTRSVPPPRSWSTVRSIVVLLALALALALLGCRGDAKAPGACASDAECTAPGTRCDVAAGRCVCSGDEACEEGAFCNSAGVCQARAGCASSADCPAETFCDLSSGECLRGPALSLGGACGVSSQCPYGAVCVGGACQGGCFDDGDCVLGEVCFDGACTAGVCGGDDFCGYGERCEAAECKDDRRGPYCRGCSLRTAQNPNPCDDARNFCLINSQESGGFRQFCGVDCSLDQPCPNGFDCLGVVILTEDTCTFNAQCKCDPQRITFAAATCAAPAPCDPRTPDGQVDRNATACVIAGSADCNGGVEGGPASCVVPRGQRTGNCTCATDADCADGGACVDGACCTGTVRNDRECRVGESRVSGFCSCAIDDDCPRDVCEPSSGRCAITGQPCTPGNDDCGPIACLNGGCLIGRNCAPSQGLSCSVVSGR
jgi:hypothetical protein